MVDEQGIISLDIIKYVKELTGFNAKDNIQRLLRDIEQSGHHKLGQWNKEDAPFQSSAISAVYYTHDRKAIRYFYLLVANEQTDTLYKIKFMVPQEYWGSLWPVVEPVFRQLFLDKKL